MNVYYHFLFVIFRMVFVVKIKLKYLFNILKKHNFVIQSDCRYYTILIEDIVQKKLNPSYALQNQIKKKLLYLKRKRKNLLSKSSGPLYALFNQMLESEFAISVDHIDIVGNESHEKIQNILSKLNNINLEKKSRLNDNINLLKKFNKIYL